MCVVSVFVFVCVMCVSVCVLCAGGAGGGGAGPESIRKPVTMPQAPWGCRAVAMIGRISSLSSYVSVRVCACNFNRPNDV